MQRACPLVLVGCPGIDSPISNTSAESADPLLFAAVAYPVYRKYKPPILGDGPEVQVDCDLIMQLIDSYSLGNPVFYADTQLYANLLALAAQWGCDWPPDDTTIGDPTIDPDTLLPNESTAVYSNDAQSATAICPNGASFTYTVPAGVKQSPPIIASLGAQYVLWANAWALAYAQLQASLLLKCITPDDDGPPDIIIPGNGSTGPPGQTPPPNIPSGPGILVYPGWMCFGNEYFQRYRIPGTFNSAYTIDISAGALAPGLTFQQVGPREATITGIPTAPGEYTWTIRAVGTFMPQFTLTAQDSLWVFGISNADTLPDAQETVDYGPEQLNATGGTAPYTFSSSNLPTGFTLSASGELSGDGSTIVAGDYTFDVTIVDDKAGECDQECSILVLAAPITCDACDFTELSALWIDPGAFCSVSAHPAWDGHFTHKTFSVLNPTYPVYYFLSQSLLGNSVSADDTPNYPVGNWMDTDVFTILSWDGAQWSLVITCVDGGIFWGGTSPGAGIADPTGTYTYVLGSSIGISEIKVNMNGTDPCISKQMPVLTPGGQPARVRVKDYATVVTTLLPGICAPGATFPAWDGTLPDQAISTPVIIQWFPQDLGLPFNANRSVVGVDCPNIQVSRGAAPNYWELLIPCTGGFVWRGRKYHGDFPMGKYLAVAASVPPGSPSCIEIESY